MEKLDFTFKPTLEHMALVKIATVLWSHDDIRNCLMSETFKPYYSGVVKHTYVYCNLIMGLCHGCKSFRSEKMSAWQKIENIVIEKALEIFLPESQKVKLISCIKPIGLEILKWFENHVEDKYLAIKLPSEFCWTSYGTIDAKKTAVALIKDEKIDIDKRFRLSCCYCLEIDIKILWKEMIKHLTSCNLEHCGMCELCFQGTMLRSRFPGYTLTDSCGPHDLLRFWHCIVSEQIDGHPYLNISSRTHFLYTFRRVAKYGHKAATEYFFQKLTLKEQEESLVKVLDDVMRQLLEVAPFKHCFSVKDHGDILRFLLSQMDNQQLLKVFKELKCLARSLLNCCLDWPWQGFISEIALRVHEFLSKGDYESILHSLIMKTKNNFKDFNYQELFSELFRLVPETHKSYFIRSRGNVRLAFPLCLLSDLFDIKDKKNISLILKDATAEEKDKIIFCNESKDICVELACNNEWDLLEFFVTECIASREKLIQFREEITEHASHVEGKTAEEKKLCLPCLQLLDNLITKKRRLR